MWSRARGCRVSLRTCSSASERFKQASDSRSTCACELDTSRLIAESFSRCRPRRKRTSSRAEPRSRRKRRRSKRSGARSKATAGTCRARARSTTTCWSAKSSAIGATRTPSSRSSFNRNRPRASRMSKRSKQQNGRRNGASAAGLEVVTPSPPLVEAAGRHELKLDLGCGLNPKDGFEGVDLYGEKATHRVDLFKFPWAFKDASVDELFSAHFLEHIPAREIEERDLVGAPYKISSDDRERWLGEDMFFAFMDECYRILKPDAWMHIWVPSGRSSRAFWDPTHRRFYMQETFLYLNEEWRTFNGLEHYRTRTNFGVDVGQTIPNEEALFSAEAQAERFKTRWNVTYDWVAKIKKLPRLTTEQLHDVQRRAREERQKQASQAVQAPSPPVPR